MVMEGEGNSVFLLRYFSESVHSAAEDVPFFIIHHIFMSEYGYILLPLYAVALFGCTDDFGAHFL